MQDGVQLKYGQIRGGHSGFVMDFTDAEAVAAQSGRFVYRNTSTGYGEIADTTAAILGHMEHYIDASTLSVKAWVVNDLTAVFRIPLAYDGSSYSVNYSKALLGECCDLYVSGGKQYADLTNISTKQLLIVGGKAAVTAAIASNDGYLDVMINPSALGNLGVGA